MNSEISVNIGAKTEKIYLKSGFFKNSLPTARLHSHTYTEIHFVLGTQATVTTDGGVLNVKSGDIFIIPRGMLHCYTHVDTPEKAHFGAFQVDIPCKAPELFSIGEQTLCGLFDEIEGFRTDNRCTVKLCAYISLLCGCFCNDFRITPQKITDYRFIINEFFADNYSRDVKVSDLAAVLNLSERQTERLVIKYSGNTFVKELTRVRTAMANRLSRTTSMTMSEIAEYIGYKSYAGYWKAANRR